MKNKASEKYADIEDGNVSAGTQILHWEYLGGNTQRWYFTHLGNGYYSIKSANSSSSYYMGVENDGTATDTPVVLRTGTLTDGMKWKIDKTTSGAYKITPKTGEANNRVLAVGFYVMPNNGTPIKQRDYVQDDNYKDEWVICSYDHTILLAIDDSDGSSRHTYFSETKANLEQEKNAMVSVVSTSRYSSCSVDDMIAYLQENEIFIVHTHGMQTGFKISNDGITYITMEHLRDADLSNISLALLMTCNTGVNYSDDHILNNTPVNIVEQMVLCGAETVVGFKDTTMVYDCNKFAPDLTSRLVDGGLSIEDAIDDISYTFYIKNMASIAEIGGNNNNTIR